MRSSLISDAESLTVSQKLILAGLYLSKFGAKGTSELGFGSFREAFNVIGYSLGSRPASIKNYRDEFDPLFPNERRGWHHRPTRQNCLVIFRQFGELDIEPFTALVRSFFNSDYSTDVELPITDDYSLDSTAFAQRLVTGLAAERYFESKYSGMLEFQGLALENTTQYGCGYDFRLSNPQTAERYLAIEVKGMMERTGNIVMTAKEFAVAKSLRERFFLVVVRNFRQSPFHTIFKDPISRGLNFKRSERTIVQVSWTANV